MFLVLLALFNCCLFAQTLKPCKFFPSAVGNVWDYGYSTGIYRFVIVSDSLLPDSSKYIYFAPNTEPIYRIDEDFNVFGMPLQSNLNWHYYKLDADSGDHWMVRPETTELQRWEAQVRNKYQSVFYNHPTTIMEITF